MCFPGVEQKISRHFRKLWLMQFEKRELRMFMKNILPKKSIKLVCLVALAMVAFLGMAARAGDNGPLKNPQASPSDAAPHKNVDVTNWGPPKTIQKLDYTGLPLSEVANQLKEMFKDEFDILLPPQGQGANLDYLNYTIDLHLKDVTAAEIFNAMNLMFDAGHTPVRWDLITNGNRPTALLRPLTDGMPEIDPSTGLPTSLLRPPEKPMVFFVGDLLGERANGFMTMGDVLSTVTDLCRSASVTASISGHEQAELLVARGTDSDLKFVQDTLTALRQKVRLDTVHRAEAKAEKEKTSATSKP